jgi:hypothetical protein
MVIGLTSSNLGAGWPQLGDCAEKSTESLQINAAVRRLFPAQELSRRAPNARSEMATLGRPQMWCKHCQQDVPGIADGEGGVDCARCGALVRLPAMDMAEQLHVEFNDRSHAEYAGDAPATDTWQLDQQLAEAERLLKAFVPLSASTQNWHLAQTPQAANHLRFDSVPPRDTSALANKTQSGSGFLAWLFLLAGTMALVCGGVLVGWSLYASRAALWNLGLPILLGGQAALLLGVVLQVTRIWQNHRAATARLAQVDRQLDDLQQTTTLLGNSYGAGSSTFFAHLAEGASPHLLLADLKGQIDLLAMKVARK